MARRARRTTPRHLVGRTGSAWLGERSGRDEDAPARRSAAGATSRSATRRAATCSSSRAARPRQRRPRCTTSARGSRRAAAADHRLHDQRGGVRARARPLRAALRVHHLRQPRLGPLGAPLRPTSMAELAADAAGAAARARRRQRARVRALDGRDDRPGAGDPLPGAGARPGARRRPRPAARARRARRCASSARWAPAPPAAGREPRARPWLGEWVFSRRVPARAARARARAAAPLRPPPRRPQGVWRALVGVASTTTRCRGWSASRRRRSSCTASATRWPRISNARLLAARIPDAELAIVPGAGHAYLLERPRGVVRAAGRLARPAARPIAPGRARTGVAARAEPLTRALGLPIGAARTGASLAGAMTDRLRKRRCPCGD